MQKVDDPANKMVLLSRRFNGLFIVIIIVIAVSSVVLIGPIGNRKCLGLEGAGHAGLGGDGGWGLFGVNNKMGYKNS